MRAGSRRFLSLVMLVLAAPATAGSLRGSIEWEGTKHGRYRDSVVWVEQVPDKVEHRLRGDGPQHFWKHRPPVQPLPKLVERNRRYEPRVVAVPAGGRLVIQNDDAVWHGPFSVSRTHPFDLGKRAPGRSDTLTFDRAGTVSLRCDIHPEMNAFVVVTPNHAFTRPDSVGSWRLPDLPAGRYEVRAWHPGKGELHHRVDVPAKGTVFLPLHW